MKTLAVILGLLLAPALFAADVDTLLNEAAAVQVGDNKAWLDVRGRIVDLGADVLPALQLAGAEESWTADGWVRAMVAQSCALRIESPELAAAVDAPAGLNPEHYKLARKPEPYCQMELARHGTAVVPLLLERWRFTLESFAYSKGDAGKLERDCLGKALLFVPGQLADRRARFMLEAALRDINLPDEWRQHAAVSFGQTCGKEGLVVIAEIFDDEKQSMAVREACGWAFGRVAEIQAAEALQTRLGKDGLTAGLRRALLNGVGLLGSSWAWKAKGVMFQLKGDEIRQMCAEMLVAALQTMPAESESISIALSLAAWEPSLQAVNDLTTAGETAGIRDAAKVCLEPLKTAVDRNKK